MRLLACDLGGTNIRFGLGDAGELDRASVHSFANDRFSGFGEALAHYLGLTGGVALDGAVVALAAPADGDTVRLTNRDWTISARDIATVARTGRVVLVNDFAALGAALSRPASLDCAEVLPGSPGDGVRLVLGAGTGFNASALIAGRHVLSAEFGHTTFASAPGLETQLRDGFAASFGRCSHDRVLSGSGLMALYRLQCRNSGRHPGCDSAGDVTRAAGAGEDGDAVVACRTFATMLGRAAGDLALTFLPRGGIYLTGGVTRALGPFITGTDSPFSAAFFAKGRMRDAMADFPVSLIRDDTAALAGCLAWIDLHETQGCGATATGPD